MEINSKRDYIGLILIHFVIAIAIFAFKPLGKIYMPIVGILGFFWILKNENKNNEVLYVCGYITGAEVLHRMTSSDFIFEFAKYSIAFFSLMGVFYSGMSRRATVFLFFLVLLIPSIVIGAYSLNFDAEVRKNLVFNISGPVVLALASLYCYEKKITLKEFNTLLFVIALPIVATTFYLFLYNPNVKEVVTGTSSNFEASGGYGPNQVSTILGLGVFIFFSRLLIESKQILIFIINLFVLFYIAFRGFITFSRGGMITGGVMMIVLLVLVYRSISSKAKGTLILFVVMSFFAFIGVWAYTSSQTNGLIERRYANEDSMGRKKQSQLTGREELMESELKMFMENPVFGVGVAKGREVRNEATGIKASSHNEITRMIAEHGSIGLLCLFILFFVPINYYYLKRYSSFNIYAIPFVIFWLLTLNHAAMRLVAPAFIYALSLLNVYAIDEETVVHRE